MTRFIVLCLLMMCAAYAAYAVRPTQRIADLGEKVDLERMIPERFGDWQQDKNAANNIVNPEVKNTLADLYSQTLSRVYINPKGERIMLTIAYGADQTDSKALHYPEVCYPSQGFQIQSSGLGVIHTGFGDIKVKHLYAVMGTRTEPITYWTTVGNKVVEKGRETKLEQLRYGLHGQIPDGLLFRVSSINADSGAGYSLHQAFINDLSEKLSASTLLKLAGLQKN